MKLTKTILYILILFCIGFLLRIIAAANSDVGTDEIIYTLLPLNIIDAQRLGTVEQSTLFFYLEDLTYKISNGVGPIASRFPSILFGSLAIIIIYLLTKELFQNNTAALFSAALVTFSGFILRHNTEMDMVAFFL